MVRQSNFELLRLVCMFYIILGHLFLFFVAPNHPDEAIWTILQYPLHVAVILFVLISGYFGIKLTVKGLTHFLALVFIIYTPLQIFDIAIDVTQQSSYIDVIGGGKSLIYSFFFVSKSPYWFVRCYLWLMLISPMVNSFISNNSRRQLYLLLVTGFMTIYMGLINSSDGKNVVYFIFLYSLGTALRQHIERIRKIKTNFFSICYVALNINIIFAGCYIYESDSYSLFEHLFYPYTSIGLILNAVLLFILTTRITFSSIVINKFATGCFAMYIIHQHGLILHRLIGPVVNIIDSYTHDKLILFVMYVLFSLLIMILSYMAFVLLQKPIGFMERIFAKTFAPIIKLKE